MSKSSDDASAGRLARMPDAKGVKLAVKMLKQIRKLGYRECGLREFERRLDGQSSGEQRDLVGEYLEKARRDPDPHVLAGMTALLTDFLNIVFQDGCTPNVETYDDLDAYLDEKADDGEEVVLDARLQAADMSRPQ